MGAVGENIATKQQRSVGIAGTFHFYAARFMQLKVDISLHLRRERRSPIVSTSVILKWTRCIFVFATRGPFIASPSINMYAGLQTGYGNNLILAPLAATINGF
jgi:hypothetical protein